jgi:nucleoside phosphorylase
LIGGTILLPRLVISRPRDGSQGAEFATEGAWCARVSAAVAGHRPVAAGTLLTSARALESTADKRDAFRETGAAAVDMESAAVAEIAAAHGLPFIAARVIVDTAADPLPGAVMAATRMGQLRIWRLAAALAATPTDIPAVIRLARRYRTARGSLGCLARAAPLAAP